jgi:hypothetical protein
MTFISPQRGSLAPVVEPRPPIPQLVGTPPARDRRGEMFFFLLSLFAPRRPQLAPIVQRAAQRRLPTKVRTPPR